MNSNHKFSNFYRLLTLWIEKLLIINALDISSRFNKVNYVFIFQEALLSIVAAALLIGVGIITLDSYDHPELGSPAGKALAGLSISAGGLFIINLFLVLLALREHR